MKGLKLISEKNIYCCYFLSSILLSSLMIFISLRTFESLNFTIGQLAVPVYLAGLDWEPLISSSEYYGYGLKWILFPVYKYISNPYYMYVVSTMIYAILICILGYFFYKIAILYWNMENTVFNALMFSIVFRVHDPIDAYTNELLLLIAYMLLCIFIVMLIEKKKHKIMLSVLIMVWLNFMITIHERALVATIALLLIAILYRFIYKEWIINFKFAIPTYVLFYWGENQLTNYIQDFFWMEKKLQGNLVNTSALAGNHTWLFKSWENFGCFLREVFANLLTLQLHTYGSFSVIFSVCVIVFILIIRKDKECKQFIDTNKSLVTIVLFSVFATLGIILGLGLNWGKTILNENLYGYKAYGYYRYFLCFIWPAFLGNFLIISKLVNNNIKKAIIILSVVINGVVICFWEHIAKTIISINEQAGEIHLERIGIFEFVQESTDEKLVIFSIKCCVILLFLLLKGINKNRMNLLYPILIIITITVNFTSFGKYMSFPDFTKDDFYEMIHIVQENEDDFSKEIYVNGSGNFIKKSQIMFPRHTIIPYKEDGKIEKVNLIISSEAMTELEETMWNQYETKKGFLLYKRK